MKIEPAAAGAIGAKYLARADARRVAVFGSAVHAESQLKAVAAVRNLTASAGLQLQRQSIVNPLPKSSARELGISVHARLSAEEALENADIVITATDSKTPVFDGSQLNAGTHITSIANGDKTRKRQEIDETDDPPRRPDFRDFEGDRMRQ